MSKAGSLSPSKMEELLICDLSDSIVHRESEYNIDILLVNRKLDFVICIENKIDADFSDHQLEKYYNYVEENYNDFKTRVYLTLTPFKNENHLDFKAGDNYTNISYKNIVTLLKANENSIEKSIPTVKESIKQYKSMIQKDITKTSKEVKLAQEIYKKYKDEIEFI